MLMTPPRSVKEWAVGLISTVIGSIAGGASLIIYFHLQPLMYTIEGLLAVLGIVFVSGLPAWGLVRSVFTWLEKREGQDIEQVVRDVLNNKALEK